MAFTDDFNRADGALGAGWSPLATDGGLTIVSSRAQAAQDAHLGNYRTGESYDDDQYAEVEVTSALLDSGDFIGPMIRCTGTGEDFYTVFYFNNPPDGGAGHEHLYLYKRTNNTFAEGDGGFLDFRRHPDAGKVEVGTLSPGDRIRIQARGPVIRAYLNDVEVISGFDLDHTSGTTGIFAFGFSALDNFEADSIATTVVSDDFNRADGNIESNVGWIADGAHLVVSSNTVTTDDAGQHGARWFDGTFSDDQASQIEVISVNPGHWFGVTVREQDGAGNNYLAIYFNNGGTKEVRLYKTVANSFTQLGSTYTIPSPAAGDTLRIEARGTTISASLNDVEVISVTDATFTGGGLPGIMTVGTPVGDNWQGENLAAETFDGEATLAASVSIAASGARDAVCSATLAASVGIAATANKDAVASATLAISTAFSVSATVAGETPDVGGGYTIDGFPTEEDRLRQEALGRQLLGEWAPVITGTKKWTRQAARAKRGFGPEPPIQSEPGAHV